MKKDYSLQNVIQTIENYIDGVSNSDIEVDIVKTLTYVEILSELLKYEEDNIDYLFLLAKVYYIQGELYYDDAQEVLEKILKIDKNHLEARALLEIVYMDFDEEPSSIELYNKLENLEREQELLTLSLLGDYKEIENRFDKNIFEKYPEILFEVYIMNKQLDKALACIDKLSSETLKNLDVIIEELKKTSIDWEYIQLSKLISCFNYCVKNNHYEHIIKRGQEILGKISIEDDLFIEIIVEMVTSFCVLEDSSSLEKFIFETYVIIKNRDELIEKFFNAILDIVKDFSDAEVIANLQERLEDRLKNNENILALILLKRVMNLDPKSEGFEEISNETSQELFKFYCIMASNEVFNNNEFIMAMKELSYNRNEEEHLVQICKIIEETPNFINKVTKEEPNNILLYLIESLYNLLMNNTNEAQKLVNIATQIDSSFPEICLTRACISVRTNNKAEAKELLLKAKELSEIHIGNEKWNEIINFLEEALDNSIEVKPTSANKTRKLDL